VSDLQNSVADINNRLSGIQNEGGTIVIEQSDVDQTGLEVKSIESSTAPPFIVTNSDGDGIFTVYPDGSIKIGANSIIINDNGTFTSTQPLSLPAGSTAGGDEIATLSDLGNGGNGSYCPPSPTEGYGYNVEEYFVNLQGCDLSGFNFDGSILRGSNLAGANLTNTNLYSAGLEGNDLSNVDFTNANAEGVSFTDSKLQGAIFTGTILYGANFGMVQIYLMQT
ncbi:MAG: pentapeptide repeat-containing protein, partial [Ignavibacteriae bacterium]|nr:pentapeptide repeat-containing protein [Ignavibacteriota bacterium]